MKSDPEMRKKTERTEEQRSELLRILNHIAVLEEEGFPPEEICRASCMIASKTRSGGSG